MLEFNAFLLRNLRENGFEFLFIYDICLAEPDLVLSLVPPLAFSLGDPNKYVLHLSEKSLMLRSKNEKGFFSVWSFIHTH